MSIQTLLSTGKLHRHKRLQKVRIIDKNQMIYYFYANVVLKNNNT